MDQLSEHIKFKNAKYEWKTYILQVSIWRQGKRFLTAKQTSDVSCHSLS